MTTEMIIFTALLCLLIVLTLAHLIFSLNQNKALLKIANDNNKILKSIAEFQTKSLEFYEDIKKNNSQLIDIVEEVTKLDTLDD